MQQMDLGLLQRGSAHCTTMHQSNLQAQAQALPMGHTIHRVTALCPAEHCRDRAVSPSAVLLLGTGLMYNKKETTTAATTTRTASFVTDLSMDKVCVARQQKGGIYTILKHSHTLPVCSEWVPVLRYSLLW